MYRLSYLTSTLCAVILLSTSALSAGDVAKGNRLFNKCKACHVVNKEKNRIGPHLVELFGRKAGSVEKFRYSKALKNSGIVWNEKTLDAFLIKPRSFVKGTRMSFAGLKKDKDRENIIAYLKAATKRKQ
jgi:cytochrome c